MQAPTQFDEFSPEFQATHLVFVGGRDIWSYMRILVAVEPKMYRETLVHCIRTNRPDADVRLADPDSLDREASSFGPHLIVCNDDAPNVRGVNVPSWVVVRYHDGLDASVILDEQDTRLYQDMSIEDLIGVVEETQRLLA
jgi:hypothetical protein